mgnify:CR=1 FL=1
MEAVLRIRELKPVREAKVTQALLTCAYEKLSRVSETDVIVVGAGPSGLTAARYTAKAGLRTVVLERDLSFGGGIGGGGMNMPCIVVEQPAEEILEEVGCSIREVEDGVFTVDPAEAIAKLASSAIDAGAQILLGITVEDVVIRMEPKPVVRGVVAQWTSVSEARMHVDPLAFESRAVVDCTGHDARVIAIVCEKVPELGLSVKGTGPMDVEHGERAVVEYTGKICEGLYAAGMAVSELMGLPRMGPIFGGMLLSGRKVAEAVIEDLIGNI